MLGGEKSSVLCVCAKSLQSCPALCNPMDCIGLQAPMSTGSSRQECWSGLPCWRDLPDPEIKPASHVFCLDRWVLYHSHPQGSPGSVLLSVYQEWLPGEQQHSVEMERCRKELVEQTRSNGDRVLYRSCQLNKETTTDENPNSQGVQ